MVFLVKRVVGLMGSLSLGVFFYYALDTNLEPFFPIGIIIWLFEYVSQLNIFKLYAQCFIFLFFVILLPVFNIVYKFSHFISVIKFV